MNDETPNTEAPRVSSSAERSRLHRERQREGRQMLALELTKAPIDRLVEAKLLAPDKHEDRDALAAAVAASLDRDGARPEAAPAAEPQRRGDEILVKLWINLADIDFMVDAQPVPFSGGRADTDGIGRCYKKWLDEAKRRWLQLNVPSRTWGDRPSTAGRPNSDEELAEIQARWRQRQKAKQALEPVEDVLPAVQRTLLRTFLKTGKWPADFGPKPCLPGCVVTRGVLEEAGIAHLYGKGELEIELPEPETGDDPLEPFRSPDASGTRFWR